MEEKQYDRREFSRALLGGLAVIASSTLGCENVLENRVYENKDSQEKKVIEKYSLDDFKEALGDRYDSKKENELREFWSNERNRETIYNIYSTNKSFEDKELGRKYEEFDPSKLSEDQLEKYLKVFPWKLDNDGKITGKDKVVLFLYHSVQTMEVSVDIDFNTGEIEYKIVD